MITISGNPITIYTSSSLLMPPGAMSLKIQAVFLFFSRSRMCIFIGLLDFREHVMCFFCREKIQERDAGDVL